MKRLVLLLVVSVALVSVSCVRQSWKKTVLYLSGPCESCPTSRVTEVFTALKGVYQVKIDSTSNSITLIYDGNTLNQDDLIAQLNDYGYGTADYPSIIQTHVAGCCQLSQDETLASQILGGADNQLDDEANEMEEIINGSSQLTEANGASFLARGRAIGTFHGDLEPSQEVELLTNPDYESQFTYNTPKPIAQPEALNNQQDDEIYHELFDLSRF
jgi:copper chaperone CopZ